MIGGSCGVMVADGVRKGRGRGRRCRAGRCRDALGEGGVVVNWRRALVSAERGDALVCVEEIAGGGPGVDDAHDVAPGAAHDAGGCVP